MPRRISQLVLSFALAIGTPLAHGDLVITYADTGDGTARPTFFDNLNVGGQLYDVTVTYNNNAAINPLPVGPDLMDSMIVSAAVSMRNALNSRTPNDAFITQIDLIPNVDPICTPTFYRISASVRDAAGAGESNWSTFESTTCREGAVYIETGYAQFTAIPEPSSFMFLAFVGLGLGMVSKLRRRPFHPRRS